MQRIELTPEEFIDYELIPSFDVISPEFENCDYVLVMSACSRLTKSLRLREAIPEHRWRYFTNADYRLHAGKGSRFDYFKRNLREGQNIFEHHDFIKYLNYFLHGSSLPTDIKSKLSEIRDDTYDSDVPDEVRTPLRRHYEEFIKPGMKVWFAEEVFKYCLDMGMSLYDSTSVRSVVMSFKNN